MDRFNVIKDLNQRYGNREINNAIANSVLPITFQPTHNNQPGGNIFVNPMGNNNLLEPKNSGNLPISITNAQRETNDPYNGLSRMTHANAAHQSRFGQIMYENGVPRSKAKQQAGNTRPPPPAWLSFLLPGVITIILLIFVISCIVKHKKHSFSTNSLKYYLEHPNQINDAKLGAAVLTARLDDSNLDNLDWDPHSDGLSSFQTDHSQLPVGEGICKQGLHYFNGLCYPCKVGYWNGVKCTTEPIQLKKNVTIRPMIVAPTVKNTLVSKSRQNQIDAQLHRYNKDFINNLNSGNKETFQSGKCRLNQFQVSGKCISCPNGLVWNGKYCQKEPNLNVQNLAYKTVDIS